MTDEHDHHEEEQTFEEDDPRNEGEDSSSSESEPAHASEDETAAEPLDIGLGGDNEQQDDADASDPAAGEPGDALAHTAEGGAGEGGADAVSQDDEGEVSLPETDPGNPDAGELSNGGPDSENEVCEEARETRDEDSGEEPVYTYEHVREDTEQVGSTDVSQPDTPGTGEEEHSGELELGQDVSGHVSAPETSSADMEDRPQGGSRETVAGNAAEGPIPDESAASEDSSDDDADEEHPQHPMVACCRFFVGGREFHIPTESLVEIAEIERLSPVPLSPNYIVGIVSIRGAVVPVVDIGVTRGTESTWVGERRLVIADAGGELLGFVADGMPDLSYELGGEPVDVRDFVNRYRVVVH